MTDFSHLTNFSPDKDPKIRWDKVSADAVEMLDIAREIAGVPFQITSHYRDPEHSVAVGGLNSDAHTEDPCSAFDIGWTDTLTLFSIIEGVVGAGFQRIGINPFNHHVHVDNSPKLPTPRLWIETPDALMVKALEAKGYTVTKRVYAPPSASQT